MPVEESARKLTDVSAYAALAEMLLSIVKDAKSPEDGAVNAGLQIALVYALLAIAEQLAISNGLPPQREMH
jgi:hypothetical protein